MQDAEDLIQHACCKVLRAKGSLVGKDYLFTTIRTLFIDGRRRKSESQIPDDLEASLIDCSQPHVIQIDRRFEIEDLLGSLRTEEREALFLNCVEGYSASEISKLTGQPRGTVLSLLARAKQRLRQARAVQDQVESQ